jgi:hypothetical protein
LVLIDNSFHEETGYALSFSAMAKATFNLIGGWVLFIQCAATIPPPSSRLQAGFAPHRPREPAMPAPIRIALQVALVAALGAAMEFPAWKCLIGRLFMHGPSYSQL